jgi:hypothetical protein
MSWWQLSSTSELNAQYAQEDAEAIACPNDGEPLLTGPDGFLYCKFDGWRPDGTPSISSTIMRNRG